MHSNAAHARRKLVHGLKMQKQHAASSWVMSSTPNVGGYMALVGAQDPLMLGPRTPPYLEGKYSKIILIYCPV